MRTVFYNTGIGDNYDSLMSLEASRFHYMETERDFYAHIYANSWQARKVCDYYPIAMADTWGKVTMEIIDNDLLFAIAPYLSKLKRLYKEAQILANIYGGAIIVRLVDDGKDFDQPINYKRIKQIDYSRVYDKWDVYPLNTVLYEDVYNPELYQYTSYLGKQTIKGLIHKSRIIRFRGKYIPPELMRNNSGWEVSILHDFLEPYSRYYCALSRTLEAIRSAEFPVVSIENLAEKDDSVKSQQEEIQQQIAQNRAIVKDKDLIEIEMVARQFTGIKELLEIAKKEIIGASDLTLPQMYNEFPDGFQATGKSELMSQALALRNKQENQWGQIIRDDLKILMAMFKNNNNYDWLWNNAYFNTPLEEAELRLTIAQTDKLFKEMEALTSEEIRESHFKQNEFINDITLK